jgi:hypothetical protein
MPKPILRLNIFISSPGDVSPEREAVLRVIERLNRLAGTREVPGHSGVCKVVWRDHVAEAEAVRANTP